MVAAGPRLRGVARGRAIRRTAPSALACRRPVPGRGRSGCLARLPLLSGARREAPGRIPRPAPRRRPGSGGSLAVVPVGAGSSARSRGARRAAARCMPGPGRTVPALRQEPRTAPAAMFRRAAAARRL